MSKINFQYDLANLTPANAQPVEANFTTVEQHINQEVIERDGSVAMRAQLKLVGDPVAALDAAPKQYVDQVLPIGLITMYGSLTPPANGRWLSCDGSPVQTATYPELFAVIGYQFGGSGGSFNVPDLRDRFPLGTGPGANHAVGARGGSEDASLPAHTHPIDHTHGGGSTSATDINHLHAGANHLHAASPIVIATSGAHHHVVPLSGSRGFLVDGIGANPADLVGGGTSYGYLPATSDDGSHGHAASGTTDWADRDLTTGWMDRNNPHGHTVSVPTFNGASGQSGVAPTGTNMPPFVTIAFIIRCR